MGINEFLNKAYELSENNKFEEAAQLFYIAAEYAKEELDDQLLVNKLLFLYHIEKLKESKDDPLFHIDQLLAILDNLEKLEDDRLPRRIIPIRDFFKILKFCYEKRSDEEIINIIEEIKKKTEKDYSLQIISVTHLLCESIIFLEKCINEDKKLKQYIKQLEECINRHKNNPSLSQEIREIFEDYEFCLSSIKKKDPFFVFKSCIEQYIRKIKSSNFLVFVSKEFLKLLGKIWFIKSEAKTDKNIFDYLELKPNMFGIGINLNEVINSIRNKNL